MKVITDDILILINEVLTSKKTNLFNFESLAFSESNENSNDSSENKLLPTIAIDNDTDLETVGIDSFGFIQLIVLIEEKYDLEIPDESLLLSELNTINKIQQLLETLLEP